MIRTYKFDSDVLAEERGLDVIVPIEVEVKISINADHEHSYVVTEMIDGGDKLNAQSVDFIEEVGIQVDLLIALDAERGDLYQAWAGEQADDYREDR